MGRSGRRAFQIEESTCIRVQQREAERDRNCSESRVWAFGWRDEVPPSNSRRLCDGAKKPRRPYTRSPKCRRVGPPSSLYSSSCNFCFLARQSALASFPKSLGWEGHLGHRVQLVLALAKESPGKNNQP